ncbi:MAG: phage baseplate protein [Anaerovoracaceae bacterium]|jgi:hypothetical protein
MARDITPYTNQIRKAVYGREVRAAIVSSLEVINDDNNKYDGIKKEVTEARDETVDTCSRAISAIARAEDLIDSAEQTNQMLGETLDDAITEESSLSRTIDSARSVNGEIHEIAERAEEAATTAENAATAADALRTELLSDKESGAFDGATFTPSVSEGGELSWTNDKGKANPPSVNIKGPKGDTPVLDAVAIGNLMYPVGSIYISVNSVDPGTVFGGIWERIKDRFLLSAGDSYVAGSTGGSANASLPSHTHSVSGTGASAGAHTHSVSGTAASAGAHTHSMNNIWSNGSGSSSAYTMSSSRTLTTRSTASAGAHTHSVSGTAASAGAHTHSVTGTAAANGVDATGKNMPPYLSVYVWKRTA